jgi:hypothetical protein
MRVDSGQQSTVFPVPKLPHHHMFDVIGRTRMTTLCATVPVLAIS